MQRIVIIGATSAIAEHCARLWAAQGPLVLTLVGRDMARMQRVRDDLLVRAPACDIRACELDFMDSGAIAGLAASLGAEGALDVVLVAHGSLPDQAGCETDLPACRAALEINGLSPVLFAEAFAEQLGKAGKGTLALIGSVAGDRGRRSNYVYGAAKGMVSRYAQGLQHRFAGSGVRVLLVKPGPTDTPMTAHLKNDGARLAPVEQVARDIVDAVARGKPVLYTPGKWRLIMLIIMHLPAVIFNKLSI
jgi:decaprenylphospho-beta-D-erythro-pentofuranosid-2-ulose 2-reductase